jgi:hypothetical protein
MCGMGQFQAKKNPNLVPFIASKVNAYGVRPPLLTTFLTGFSPHFFADCLLALCRTDSSFTHSFTNPLNTCFKVSPFYRRNSAMVLWSGENLPSSQSNSRFRLLSVSSRREERIRFIYPYRYNFNVTIQPYKIKICLNFGQILEKMANLHEFLRYFWQIFLQCQQVKKAGC